MNVNVTTFRNPFSFFCVREDWMAKVKHIMLPETNSGQLSNKYDLSMVTHGQYVAVFWNNNWVRGIISLETQFLIWLVDNGIYLRPNDTTVYVNLPAEDKKYPSKVFEASVHGISPVEKILNDMCEIDNKVSTTWSQAAVEKGQKLIAEATSIYFVPLALMSTKNNDIVIGDLYLRLKGRGVVNLIDELEKWPVFLTKDPKMYIENLSKFYTYRRQHRASLKKPMFPHIELPTVTLQTTLADYTAICATATVLEYSESDNSCKEGSTITYIDTTDPSNQDAFRLTAAEIEKYSKIYITVSGREYNVLNIVLNKARDLYICEKYKDLKSVGRATSRSSKCRQFEYGYPEFD